LARELFRAERQDHRRESAYAGRSAACQADTALRLARFFGTSERFWINLQSRYDLEIEKDRLGDALDGIRPLTAAAS
jgi:plasmid maintenance system antidote protein VapI